METQILNTTVTPAPPADVVNTGQTPPDAAPDANAIVFPENWKEAIPVDIRDSEIFKLVPDVPTMAKNYYHAQKAMGVDKIAVPSKHATADDWKNVFTKLGLPETSDKYEINVDKEKMDENFVGEFKQKAFEANILPHQAQSMLDWYMEKSGSMAAEHEKNEQIKVQEAEAVLKDELKGGYSTQIALANSVLEEIVGKEAAAEIVKLPMASDVTFIRFLLKTADFIKDTPIKGQAVHGMGTMTPAEADVEIKKLQNDPAMMDKHHTNHGNVVKELTRLFQVAHPE